VDYASLLNPVDAVKDNAGLMLIKLLIQLGVKEIWLAGMDGYSHIASENYAQEDMRMTAKVQTLDAMNQGMCQVLRELSQQADIRFLTAPKYVTLG
jgi:4-hydroxy 2-oxovalerate aldolase